MRILPAVLAVIGLSVLANTSGGVFKVQNGLPGSESQRAFDLLKEKGFGERAGIQAQIAFTSRDGVKDPKVQRAMEQFFANIERDVDNVTIASPYAAENARQIFRPLTIHVSPSRSARVVIDATSEPVSGSVSAIAPIFSPRIAGAR